MNVRARNLLFWIFIVLYIINSAAYLIFFIGIGGFALVPDFLIAFGIQGVRVGAAILLVSVFIIVILVRRRNQRKRVEQGYLAGSTNSLEKLLKQTKEMREIIIFTSYAKKDNDRLSIGRIVENWKRDDEVGHVLYFEAFAQDSKHGQSNVIEFMDLGLKYCDIFIGIFTEAYLQSDNCQRECKAALYLNKRIVPLFENIEYVPVLVKSEIGVKISDLNPDEIARKVLDMIKGK